MTPHTERQNGGALTRVKSENAFSSRGFDTKDSKATADFGSKISNQAKNEYRLANSKSANRCA